MKELRLKTASRLLLVSMLNEEGQGGGTLSHLKDMIKVIEKVELKDDEKERLDLTIDQVAGKVSWKPENDMEVTIELSDDQANLVKGIIEKRNSDKRFTIDTLAPIDEIAKQLGVE
jgi:hypothetical protein